MEIYYGEILILCTKQYNTTWRQTDKIQMNSIKPKATTKIAKKNDS